MQRATAAATAATGIDGLGAGHGVGAGFVVVRG